jgi:hypothetical protein
MVYSLVYSSTLNMEAIYFSETLGSLRTTQPYNPETILSRLKAVRI